MKRIFTFLIMLAFALSAALVLMVGEPERARAGGWPCFLCHGGFEVPGTDIAPQLAGSKLTDAQIINQVRHPRGMMPSFSEQEISDQMLKDGFIQPFVRGQSAGKPTATLSAANRSAALATISAVAAARATAVLNASAAADIPAAKSTPSPIPTASPSPIPASPTPLPATPVATTNSNAGVNTGSTNSLPGIIAVASGALILGALFFRRMRHPA